MAERGKGAGRHRRTEVRTTDPDVDDMGDPLIGTNPVGKGPHLIKHRMNLRHDIGTIYDHLDIAWSTQRDMHYGAILGDIDVLTRKHCVPTRFDTALAGGIEQGVQDGIIDSLFGEVDAEITCGHYVPVCAVRIVCEEVAEGIRLSNIAQA